MNLINRESSSNSVKGRRDLLHRMLTHEEEAALGIDGFPAERGLYETLLRTTGLHRQDANGIWRFMPPTEEHSGTFVKLWNETRKMFTSIDARVKAVEVAAMWAAAPFGVRKGVVPVLFAAFLLAHKGNVALYKDGIFIPRLTDADIDEYLQDDKRFSMRWIVIDAEKTGILSGISKILAEVGAASGARDPLRSCSLVALVAGLPAWSQRTHRISPEARLVRDTLLKAHDPHKVLFIDLAAILERAGGDSYVNALRGPIVEISGAYDALLKDIEASMLAALDAPTERLTACRPGPSQSGRNR